MKRIIPFLLLIVIFSFACSQPEKNENGETTNSEIKVGEQQTGSAETQQTESLTGNEIKRVKPEKKEKILARVNGVPIYESDTNGMSLDSAITDEILYQEALKRGMDKKYEDKIMEYQMSIVLRDMKNGVLEDMPPAKVVSDEEITKYYEDNKDKYVNFKLEELSFSDKEKADEIKKMAVEGKEFKDIKDQYPDSDVEFNDLGYNKQLTKYFDTKEAGSVSGVVEKNDGTYSILRIVEIREMPLNQLKASIRYGLEARREASAFDEYAKKISEENNFKIEIIDNSNNK